jgi:hypothetical protein
MMAERVVDVTGRLMLVFNNSVNTVQIKESVDLQWDVVRCEGTEKKGKIEQTSLGSRGTRSINGQKECRTVT